MLLLTLLWVLYFTLHSLLATLWVKDWVAGRWPRVFRFYRLAYNQLSVWGLMGVFRYQLRLPAHRLFPVFPALPVAGYCVAAGGALVAVLALRGYNLGEFAGWRYVRHGAAAADTPLLTQGLNSRVRHPLYGGLVLLLLGFWLILPTGTNSIFVACSLLYVAIGTRLEEQKLLRRFGLAYARYQVRVPALLPRLWVRP